MPLDPQAAAFLQRLAASRVPGLERMPVPLARASFLLAMQSVAGRLERVASIEDRALPGHTWVRVYTPALKGPLPALIYFHGGGWVVGSPDSIEAPCRQLANQAECVVISVAYRLAPEHRFPAAVEDCYDATLYLIDHAEHFGFDPDRVAIGGDSAGGNLAAVVALLARDRGGPKLSFQLLIYPPTDSSLDTPSHRQFSKGYMLTRAQIAWFRDHYVSRPADLLDWRAAPMRAPDLSGLPPARVITAEFDPLRDDGEAYAARLSAASVPVTVQRYPGMIHGFFQMSGIIDAASLAVKDAARALRTAWNGEHRS